MKVLEILKRTEEDLREVIAEAARNGDYRTVDIGRSIAINIKELSQRISENGAETIKSTGGKKPSAKRKELKKFTRRSKPNGLPRIEIRNGSLYRIGWSRKQKREYEHKVPRAAFDTIVNTMSALAMGKSGPFMAEAIIEKISATKEDAIPAYQFYVVLAALREWSLITQVGREGYNIQTNIAEKAQCKWSDLSNKN